MFTLTHTALADKLRQLSKLCALLVFVQVLLVLLMYVAEGLLLTEYASAYPPMRVNTALALTFIAASLWTREPSKSLYPALGAGLLAGLVLLQYLTGTNLHIDQFFFPDKAAASLGYSPGRMPLNAIAAILLLLIIVHTYTKPKPGYNAGQLLSVLVFLTACVTLISHLFSVEKITTLEKISQMGPHTALCFMLLAAGFFCRYPERGFLKIILSNSRSARLLRQLYGAAILLPMGLSVIVLLFFREKLLSAELGFAVFVIAHAMIFLAFLFRYGASFGRYEEVQRRQELQIQQLNAELSRANIDLKDSNQQLNEANAALRQLSEEALLESSRQYTLLADSIGDMFYALDDQLRISFWNKACETHFHIPAAGAVGKRLEVLMPENPLNPPPHLLQKVMEERKAAKLQVEQQSAETVQYFELRIYPAEKGLVVFSFNITALKEVKQALRLEKERLEMALWGGELGLWDWFLPDNEVLVNDQWATMLGYLPGELAPNAETWQAHLHPDDRDRIAVRINEHLAGKTDHYRSEHRILSKSGKWKWILDSGKVVERDAAGKPLRMVGVHQDISQLKEAEAQEREQRERLALALESASLATWDYDVSSGKSIWSDRWFHMLGYAPQEFEGGLDSWQMLVHPDDVQRTLATLNNHLQGKTDLYISEHRLLTKAGQWLWTIGSGKVIQRNEQGEPLRMLGIQQDISELKKAEQSYSFFKFLVDSTNEPIYWISPADLKISYANEAACRHFGFSRQQLLNRCISELNATLSSSQIREKCRQVEEAGTLRFQTVHQRAGKSTAVPVEVTANYLRFNDTPYIVSFVRDISEQQAHEAQIKSLNVSLEQKVVARTAELENINRELEAFSYAVSHDLRAPLRIIDGFSKALAEDYQQLLDAQGLDFLQRIRCNTQRMGQLIDDLLNLSRVSRTSLHKEEVNISQLAAELMQLQAYAHTKATQEVESGLLVQADVRLLRIALENLLNNAFKYSSKVPQPHICFGCKLQEGRPVFFVQDNGAGFEMKYATRLFGAFQRLHSAEEFEGSGIGLATVQRIIHRHGGRIWAEASPGKGAAFFFTLA